MCRITWYFIPRVPAANAPGCTAAEGLLYKPLSFSRSYLNRQVSVPETLVVKGGTTWARNGRWILPENSRLPRNIQGSFTCRKSTTWDKRLYFPSEGKRAEDFFALKNPKALAGFEPANLGTKGQHATSIPPKPLSLTSICCKCLFVVSNKIGTYVSVFGKCVSKWNCPHRRATLVVILKYYMLENFVE